ncbi:MAG: hypothetical protein IPI30_12320 [Saprospiraceae bacterium]|nr:hypothetical protein [Candidatus Vicinibacter affinis]
MDRFGQAWIPAHVFLMEDYDNCPCIQHRQEEWMMEYLVSTIQMFMPEIQLDFVVLISVIWFKVMLKRFLTDAEGNSNTCDFFSGGGSG